MTPRNSGVDQAPFETYVRYVNATMGDEVGHLACGTQALLADLIAQVIELWRERQDYHKEEKSRVLRIKARCRRLCDGNKMEGTKLYKAMMSKRGAHPLLAEALVVNKLFLVGLGPVRSARKEVEKKGCLLVARLPAADWWCSVYGLNLLGLFGIVGECGDLSNYATTSRVWKRMGVAVMPDGTRQRKVRGAAAKEHGYNPARHAVLWSISDSLFMHQSKGEVPGPYRVVYDEYRSKDEARYPDMPKGHLHNRARRYMAKRLLCDLWVQWNKGK